MHFSSLKGKEYAYSIHGFEVKIHSSTQSAIEEVDSGSSKVLIKWILLFKISPKLKKFVHGASPIHFLVLGGSQDFQQGQ